MNTPTPSRRDFLRCTCSASLIALGAGLAGCDSTDIEEEPEPGPGSGTGITVSGDTITLDLDGSQAQAVATAGGFLAVTSAKTVVINDAGTIKAFTSICTHQQCDIDRFQNNQLVCPCHNSRFNTDGQVVSGPAPSPIRQFNAQRSGDTVTITKS